MNFLVDALKRELAAYERRGLDDRARQVMEQLVLLGCEEFLITLKKSSSVSAEENSLPKAAARVVSKATKKVEPTPAPAAKTKKRSR
jgi:hypothetical protein